MEKNADIIGGTVTKFIRNRFVKKEGGFYGR